MFIRSWRRAALCSTALATAVCIFAPTIATAQTEVETVVVTARKRSEDLQKVPVAVTAFSQQQLEQQGVRTPTDLAKFTPSLSISPTVSVSSPVAAAFDIRGQVASDIIPAISQAVGLYEDGVNIPLPVGTNVSLFDLQRVEVLKGPQGTLYGRNTTGGAINIITRDADFNGIHGYVGGEYGNFDDWKINGAINIPLVDDKLAARLAYQHWNREGFGKSLVTGQRLGGAHDDDTLRLSVLYTPTNDLTIGLKAEYTRANIPQSLVTLRAIDSTTPVIEAGLELGQAPFDFTPGNPCFPLNCGVFTAGGAAIGAITSDRNIFHNYQSVKSFDKFDAWTLGGTITWNVSDDVQVKSITGYRTFSTDYVFDLDGTPFTLTSVGVGGTGGGVTSPFGAIPFPLYHDETSDSFSEELNVSGQLYEDRVNWLLGAYYSDMSSTYSEAATAVPYVIQYLSNGFSVFDNLAPSVGDKSWSIFTQEDFKITDKLTLTAGGRYTEEKKSLMETPFNFSPSTQLYQCNVDNSIISATFPPCRTNHHDTFTGPSYLFSLSYQLNDRMMVYAKTAAGFRGGAEQIRAPTFPAAQPEKATDYEVGFKGSFFGNRLRTDVDVYQTHYANKQVSTIVQFGNASATVLTNAASARIRGFEGQFDAIPFDDLTLSGTLTYLEGIYLNYPAALSVLNVPFDASGLGFTGEPKWRYSLSARYRVPTPIFNGNLAIQADWAWHGKSALNALNVDPGIPLALYKELTDSVGLMNARVDYTLPDYDATVSFFVTNLFDKHYQTLGLPGAAIGGPQTGITQEPRMFGIQIRKNFGDE